MSSPTAQPIETESSSRRLNGHDLVLLGTAVVLILGSLAGLYLAKFADGVGTSSWLLLCLAGVGLLVNAQRRTVGTLDRYADQIRQTVDAEAEAPAVIVNGADATVHFHPQSLVDPATARASAAIQKQEAILREIYTQGLAQAKASFKVSIWFASIGSAVLIAGVALAILFAGSNGEKYSAIVAGTSGTVISLTSSLFYVQSNRARANMVRQGALLREESQDDRRLSAARELVDAIEETGLRDNVRAQLALGLLQGTAEVPPGTSGATDPGQGSI
ncbi:hypothetical protein ACFQO7_34865 [Catellatospora aurea]|uniref:Cyanobacterial TRADD-N associated 2 transmembrane domain-containing protein n=1 Tax=Catellatospora aurea TaxID=1337874 RepID=A0ABW2H8P3_9ACTN